MKNKFWIGGIQPPPVLLECPSALLSNKGALLLQQRAFLGEKFDQSGLAGGLISENI